MMKKIILAFIGMAIAFGAAAQVEQRDTFYTKCALQVMNIKDHWPSEKNAKGDFVPMAAYKVSKEKKQELANAFMHTDLCLRAFAQVQKAKGMPHYVDGKTILSREVKSATFKLNIYDEEYEVLLQRHVLSGKWMLEYRYSKNDYGEKPKTNVMSITVNGSQMLQDTGKSTFNVVCSIATLRRMKPYWGLDLIDSSSNKPYRSESNEILGRAIAW